MPIEIVDECRQWILNASNNEREQVSFELLQRLVEYVDSLTTEPTSIQMSKGEQDNFIGSSGIGNYESVSKCASIASIETMIVYEEEEEKPTSSNDEYDLEWAVFTVQKMWRIAKLQFHIQDRQALLDSSCTSTTPLKSDSTLNATEAWVFADFLSKYSLTNENISPNQVNLLNSIDSKEMTTGKLIKRIISSWHQGIIARKSFGEWLSGPDDLNRMTLCQFLEEFDFSGQFIVDALRYFLDSFELPGEAQRIDRVMNEFAQTYYRQNQYLFSSPDIVYILSFSIVLLNTDAHNLNVKSKMNLEQFIKNNRQIFTESSSTTTTTTLLTTIYQAVLKREICSKEEATEKLKKIIQCTTITDQSQLQYFNTVLKDQTYLGTFYCYQTNSSDLWPSILFRKERIVLITDGSFILLRLCNKGAGMNNKYECKICKSLRNVHKVFIGTSHNNSQLLNVTIQLSNVQRNEFERCNTINSITLVFKTVDYANAFNALLNETIQSYLIKQNNIKKEKMKSSKQKAQQTKLILESIYKPIK